MTERKHLILLLIGIIIIFISPLLFSGILFNIGINFLHTGEIGDTIGGITAPLVGVFGAYLVYLSFQKQIEANNILRQEIDRSNFFTTYNEITQLLDLTNKQFDNISYNDQNGKDAKGEDAFDSWFEEKKDLNVKKNKHFLKECSYVLELVDKTTKSIEAFIDKNDVQIGQAKQQKGGSKFEISNSNFNFKNLLRLKFLHFYQLRYNSTIIRLNKFDEAKEIEKIYFERKEFDKFIEEKSTSKNVKDIYYHFQRILTTISNIDETLKTDNNKFWGDKPNKI